MVQQCSLKLLGGSLPVALGKASELQSRMAWNFGGGDAGPARRR